jgi:hypothetical protein
MASLQKVICVLPNAGCRFYHHRNPATGREEAANPGCHDACSQINLQAVFSVARYVEGSTDPISRNR